MIRIITPFFSIIISILLYFLYISPMYSDIKEIQAEAQTFETAAVEYDNFNRSLNRLLEIKNSQTPLVFERLNRVVPADIDTAHIVADLESMAKAQNMLFGDISTDISASDFDSDEQTYSAELQTADISFDLIGTYDQFQAFLKELESSLTIFEVVSMEFDSSGGIFEQFSMTVRVYALPSGNN